MINPTQFLNKLAYLLHSEIRLGKLRGVSDIEVRKHTMVVNTPGKRFRIQVDEETISNVTHNRQIEPTDEGLVVKTLSGAPVFELKKDEFDIMRSVMDRVETAG